MQYKNDLQKESKSAKDLLKRNIGLRQLHGKSKAIQNLHKWIHRISSCDVNILITGESGTGKELIARAIHYLGTRRGKPFIPVNCGAIPESLFENELFGHAKGAFTDANFQQIGLVQEAEGGTLFLDEIGTISPYIQVKLLRLLQDREYKPLGDSKNQKADIRIIAATNIDLSSLVKENNFREDLFYRLNVVHFHIPPLRERKEDIPILIDYFVEMYSRLYNKPTKIFTEETFNLFLNYHWPGNIRELENKIQQLVVMSHSLTIHAEDIGFPAKEPCDKETELELFQVAKKKAVDSFERSYLIQLLTNYMGDVVSAADKAGKSRTALWNLLKKHNLSPKQFRC